MEDGISLTESVNQAVRVMRITKHTEVKITPFELHRCGKPRTELTNTVKSRTTYYLIVEICLFQNRTGHK